MKRKNLLFLLLALLLAPWAANAQKTAPYNEGFEGMSNVADLNTAGWEMLYQSHSGSFLAIETSASNVHSGSKALNIDSWDAGSSSDWVIVGLPTITNKAVNELQMTFSYKVSTGNVDIGYLTDPDDYTTFKTVSSFNSSSSYSTKTVEFGEVPPTASRIAIKYTNWYRCYVDDVEVKVIPTCPQPTLNSEVATTNTTATVSWTPSGDNQQLFDLYWSTSNSAPSENTAPSVSNYQGTSYELNFADLNASSTYYVWVRGNCGTTSNPDISGGWAGPVSFDTPCDAISDLPWTVDFEDMTANTVPNCWDNSASTTSDVTNNPQYVWGVYSYSSSNKVLRMYNYLVHTGTALINTPSITLPANSEYLLYFDYAHDASCGAFKVKISEDGGTTFVEKGSYTNNSGTFTAATPIDLSSYAGKTIIVQFFANANYGSGAIFVDNFRIDLPVPTITEVVSSTPLSTTITWTSASTTATGYTYQYKLSTATEWGTENTVGASVLTANLTTEADQTYDFRVRADYGTSHSSWVTTNFTAPGYCMVPSDLVITNVTWSQAELSWTEEFGDGEWTLLYKTSLEEEYTTYGTVTASDMPVTLPGLNVNTTYNVKIYPNCDATKFITDQFTTKCEPITEPSWEENFESYSAGIFSADCWENVRIVDGTGNGNLSSFSIYTYTNGSNSTKQLYLPDMKAGSMTKLCLRGFEIPVGANYQFSLDVYRNTNTSNYGEGIRVFASTNGEIEGATELAFISRSYTTAYTIGGNVIIPAESAIGWYSYELPIGFDGVCYIILRGESLYGSSTYMDNFAIEPVPTCGRPGTPMVAPNTLTNHSAKLTWTAPEGQEAWQIAYSTTSFDPNAANFDLTTVEVIDVTANPYTFDKTLAAATTYYMYVRGNCGNDGYSKWCKTACSFTTKEAKPKPTAVTVTNIGSTTADLYWTKGGGDFETSWDVYRVASETTPTTTPDANTEPTFTVNTLPTSEAPYVMDDLTAETKYYLWVRANHGNDGYSAWQAMTGGSFTTQVACPKPTNVAAVPSHTSANITWTGYSDSYTVEKRIAASMGNVLLSESFDGDDMPTGWEIMGSGTSNWSIEESNDAGGEENELFLYYSPSFTGTSRVVLPEFNLTGIASVSVSFKHYLDYYDGYGSQTIGIATSSDGGTTWHSGWSKSYSADASGTIEEVITTDDMNNEHVLICLYYTGNVYGVDGWYFDDFQIGEVQPADPWQVVTENATNGAYNLEGLTMNTKYDVRVTPNCGGVASDICTFTTYGDNTKIFKTEGNWNVADNWEGGIPAASNNAIIRANATIPAECDATANLVTIEGTPVPTITIKDGGQLHSNSQVLATLEKEITGYGTNMSPNNYVLIAAPNSMYASNVTNMTTGTYDLYTFNGTQDLEWINQGNNSSYYMYYGVGHLYANASDETLKFTTNFLAQSTSLYITNNYSYLNYTATPTGDDDFTNWNLVGNRLPHNGSILIGTLSVNTVTIASTSFYKMNDEGSEVEIADNGLVKPLEAVFVKSTEANQYAFVNTYVPSKAPEMRGLNMILTQGNSRLDKAIIRFGEGENFEKFQLNPNHTKIYMPIDGKNYAKVYADNQGEMPVSFKAEKNGNYSLSFNTENVEFGYLHLIDNLTGNDVDLLANPSYSFEAKTTDYASRFKLVFAAGSNANDESFAFMSDGNLIVNNEGEATLQVIDVNGRILRSESINGSASINMNTVPGVYMIRDINGENVKTQKIVVR